MESISTHSWKLLLQNLEILSLLQVIAEKGQKSAISLTNSS